MFIQIRLDELYEPPLFILFHESVVGLLDGINVFKVFKVFNVLKEHDVIQLLTPLLFFPYSFLPFLLTPLLFSPYSFLPFLLTPFLFPHFVCLLRTKQMFYIIYKVRLPNIIITFAYKI